MSGFDNGSAQGGVFFQAKQFGSILRSSGPPIPQAGVVGDLYLDTVAFNLYLKRSPDAGGDVDPWGHYLFQVPGTYQATLKWFGASAPTADVGLNGDYYLLWAGFGNYGLGQPSIYGPKAAGAWPTNPVAVAVTVNPLYTAEDSLSLNSNSNVGPAPVRVATTGANINLATIGLGTIDGQVLIAGDRVLVKDQTDHTQNGVYVASAGAWARSTDANLSSQFFQGMTVLVTQGTANAFTNWVMITPNPIVLGTTAMTWNYKP